MSRFLGTRRGAGWVAAVCVLAGCGGGALSDVDARAGASGAASGSGGRVASSASHAMPGLSEAGSTAASGAGGAGTSGRSGSAGAATGADAGHAGSHSAGSAAAGGPAAGSGGAAGAAAHSGSAGAAGAGSTTSGASRCQGSGLTLCESFEADSIDMSVWSAMQTKPTLDTTRAARGAKSLHMHTTATGASGLETKKIFPRPEGHYYGRMFVYFDALPTSPQWAHWTIVGANPQSGNGEIRVGGQYDGKLERFGVGTDQGPTGDWTNLDDDPKGAPKAVELKKWLCVEWLHDWANDETRFYVDGQEHESLHTTKDVKHGGNSSTPYEIPELGSVWVGFWNYNQNKPVTPTEFDVWIDELAFDPERIGCDR